MSDFSVDIANLSPNKRALLELLLTKKGAKLPKIPRVPREGDSNSFPLSFAQQRLWFLDQLEPGKSVYNIPKAIRLSGPVDVDALNKTLDAIVARHEVLRTTFTTLDGNPRQVITPSRSVELTITDLSERPEAEREEEVQRLLKEEAGRPFNLSQDLMLRATLLRMSGEEHILLLVMHHIASDGWSMGILFRELAIFYEAFSKENTPSLPELPIQYVDFTHWQQGWLQGDVLEEQLSYWKEQFAEGPSVLELPTDRPRPVIQTYRGKRQHLVLSKALTESLNSLSRREGVTLFMTLLTAFVTLFHRYSGQEDIVVGSPIAGRTHVELEDLIGFFVNTLVLHTNLSGNPTFRELLGQIKELALGANVHQDLPFEKLVEELKPERDLSMSPLFQVMFVLQNAPGKALELSGLTLNPLEIDNETAKFDLTLSMIEAEDGLKGSMEYNTDLFEEATITRMLGHFQILLEGIVADPEQRLSNLPLLDEGERHQLLVEWNDTQTNYADLPSVKDSSIHELFEAQVERTPDAVALIFEDQQLTYHDLNMRSNQLAYYLKDRGVGSGVIVGICIERSLEMVIGLLGILKAGGAYLPLDPSYPRERLDFMLEDSKVPLLVTHERLLEILPKQSAEVVCLDSNWVNITQESVENPTSDTTIDDPAYVIYTSGSTGKPKGVLGLHRGAINRFAWMWDAYPFKENEVCCQKTSLNFVDSVWELFGPLLWGIPTVVIPDEIVNDPDKMVSAFAAHQVTRIVLVPSLLRVILDLNVDLFSRLPNLKFWVSSGEALTVELSQRFEESMPQSVLLNLYGSSEVSADVTWYDTELMSKEMTSIPIGRPIANTQTYMLDRHLNHVPIGVPGELYIGGDGLAQGYLNLPELTAEKFIHNPFSSDPGARMYRTGDLARYLPDGNIEFLGRIDHQVKIRGFRIELGEIEAVLGGHPSIQETVVIRREDEPGEVRLVAYVVANGTPTADELRNFFKEKLPEYMLLSVFVTLETLPLTPNGKVDLLALPTPDRNRSEMEDSLVAPRDTLELQLTKIWEKVLGVQPISVKDNFFDLGGHSLLAVKLFAQIEKIIGVNLPLATLFQAPTVEHLAEALRDKGWSPPWNSLVAIQPGGSKPPFFCVHACNGPVLFYRDLVHYLGPDQPFIGLQAVGLDGELDPLTRVEDMAAHYTEEIQIFQPEGPYFLGGLGIGGNIALEMARLLMEQGQEIALLTLFGSGHFTTTNSSRESQVYYLNRLVNQIQNKGLTFSLLKKALSQARKVEKKITYILSNPQERRLQRVRKATERAERSYIGKVYPGRITLFFGSEKKSIIKDKEGWLQKWSELASGGLESYEVPGNITTMHQEPNIKVLAEKLRACLEEAQAGSKC